MASPGERLRNVGGTPGGGIEFLLGLGLVVAGGWMLLGRIWVSSGFWGLWGDRGAGALLVVFLLGMGLLLFDGKSWAGWLLAAGSVLAMVAGVLANLHFHFRPSTLGETLLTVGLLGAGLGLVARSVRPHGVS